MEKLTENDKTYKLNIEGTPFSSERTTYRPGEKVVVYFSMIATDTDYSFWSDDVSFQQDYKVSQGYIFTFGMPEHDVTLHFSARNSMIREIR
ncbi:MAG: hypothetical protein IJT03_02310 [Clostridia bacterium]|nr:hypothetical protein [Clostridia bacterium]